MTKDEPISVQPDTAVGLVAFLAPFKNRNFSLLWIGEAISLIGDQFYFIALPWLVLQITDNGFAVGAVLAITGVPRAVFMLVGGALSDRFSPRQLMFYSNIVRMVMVTVLAGLVLADNISLPMLYIFAFLFGVADAFFYPAQQAIVPQLIEDNLLAPANSLIAGTGQLSLFAGPALAGILIAAFSSGSPVNPQLPDFISDLPGIGLAFVIDAFTFMASAATLALIAIPPADDVSTDEDVIRSIWGSLVTVWEDPLLRIFYLLVTSIAFLVIGPIQVGIPVLANTRFVEGAAAFGIIMSANGGGALLGAILAGILPSPSPRRLGHVMLVGASLMGIGLMLMGLAPSMKAAAVLNGLMGLSYGYVSILGITWLQRRTPQKMLGRMMGLLVLATVGLFPISTSLSGLLIEVDPVIMFLIAGFLITASTLVFIFHPLVPEMGLSVANGEKAQSSGS